MLLRMIFYLVLSHRQVLFQNVIKQVRSRTTIQAGAEIFGDSSIYADAESISLMIESLQSLGIKHLTLSLGHAGLVSLVLAQFKDRGDLLIEDLESALSRKSVSDINSIHTDQRASNKCH